jgi:hypothetical protein
VGIVESPHDDRRKAEHRPDGQIEFAGGHEQGHPQGDHAELRSERQQIADVPWRKEGGRPRAKRYDLNHQQNKRPELRLGDDFL